MTDRRTALGLMTGTVVGLTADTATAAEPNLSAKTRLDALRVFLDIGRKLLDSGDWSPTLLFGYYATQREAAGVAAGAFGDTPELVEFYRQWTADADALAAAAARLARIGSVPRVCATLAEAQQAIARAALGEVEKRVRK